MTYKDDILKKENLTFGLIWAAISILVGSILIRVINIIDTIMSYILEALIYIISFPSQVSTWLKITNVPFSIILAIIVAVVLAPTVKRVYDWIMKMFKKNPM